MMNEKAKIWEVIKNVLTDLQTKNYSDYTIGVFRRCFTDLQRFMQEKGVAYYSVDIGLEYIKHKFGISIEGFHGKHPSNIRSTLRALQILWDYSEYGTMVVKMKSNKKPFKCPDGFKEGYESFQQICEMQEYTPTSKKALFSILQKFIIFMNDSGVVNTHAMKPELIIKFISTYSGCSTRYIAKIVSVLRNYLNVLHQEGYLQNDLTRCLPKIRTMSGGFIPSSWKQEDVHKLLNSIDRNNPIGKRDYAIILMVTRLGLRTSDIRTLKLKNINWSRKTISIVMQKTKQPLELPLLEDIGWAVIDYLKNGRPQTVSDCIFISHKAPYEGFSDTNGLGKMLGVRMSKAEIDMKGQRHGLHSLRSTLARVMLEKGAPLPIISATLGHQNIQTTSIYLKIDVEGLRNCVIDPEEVCHE